MKIHTLILTTSLVSALMISSPVLAQTAKPEATASAPIPPKDAMKPVAPGESLQLSPEKAKIYNEAMKAAADKNKDLRAQIHKAHDDADAILTAPTFDKKAFLAKAAELDQLYGKARNVMNDAFVSVAEQFSQEERKMLLRARNEHRRQPN